MGGFKNSKSANASWIALRKKLCESATAFDNATTANSNEFDNGAAADDEGSPTTKSPKKKLTAKSKSSVENGEEGKAASAKKRSRAPKDPNATPAKRVKKEKTDWKEAAKAEADAEDAGAATNGDEQADPGSIFGNGNGVIKTEEAEDESATECDAMGGTG